MSAGFCPPLTEILDIYWLIYIYSGSISLSSSLAKVPNRLPCVCYLYAMSGFAGMFNGANIYTSSSDASLKTFSFSDVFCSY